MPEDAAAEPIKKGYTPGKRATMVAGVIAVLFVVVPYLFWRDTWFGVTLSDEQLQEYFADVEHPRKAQHALTQVSERISANDQDVQRWYPEVIKFAGHELPELRLTAAWVMGQDNEVDQFHRSLLTLLDDPEAMVRRNAALALVSFGDDAGKPELRAMLEPFTVLAPGEGTLQNRLEVGDAVDRETLLARIEIDGSPEPAEVRSPAPGIFRERLLQDGARVQQGDELAVIGPDPTHVFEALRAFYMIGSSEDAESIRSFARPREGFPIRVAEQARLTLEKLRQE